MESHIIKFFIQVFIKIKLGLQFSIVAKELGIYILFYKSLLLDFKNIKPIAITLIFI